MATIDWEYPEIVNVSRNEQKEGKAFIINFGNIEEVKSEIFVSSLSCAFYIEMQEDETGHFLKVAFWWTMADLCLARVHEMAVYVWWYSIPDKSLFLPCNSCWRFQG